MLRNHPPSISYIAQSAHHCHPAPYHRQTYLIQNKESLRIPRSAADSSLHNRILWDSLVPKMAFPSLYIPYTPFPPENYIRCTAAHILIQSFHTPPDFIYFRITHETRQLYVMLVFNTRHLTASSIAWNGFLIAWKKAIKNILIFLFYIL